MEKSDVIYLVGRTTSSTVDEFGDEVIQEELKRRFAKIKSITSREFYQAESVGMKPEFAVVLSSSVEYGGEEFLVWKETRYKVLKSFIKPNDTIELTIYGGVRNERTEIGNTI